MRTVRLMLLAFVALTLVHCGRPKKEEKDSENEMKPAVHKANECPENVVGIYMGMVQKRRMIYKFTTNQEGSLTANVKIEGLTKDYVPVPVNGKILMTDVGVTSMGCEDGKINTMSVLDRGIYKAKISFNDKGMQLNEFAPEVKETQFNKVAE